MLRKIFKPKREEVTGEWRIVCNEWLNDMHTLANIIRVKKNEMGGECDRYGRQERCRQDFGGEK